jgi:hypothetical protein
VREKEKKKKRNWKMGDRLWGIDSVKGKAIGFKT